MPKLLIPIAAALAVAGATAGGATYLLTRDDAVEEVPPAVQATATPSPAAETPQATPTLQPTPPDDWVTYTDPELGFSFPQPPGLTPSEEAIDLPAKGGNPPVQQRSVSFLDDSGVFVVGISVVSNPVDLALDEWIGIYVGWPSEPQSVAIGGEPGLLFPINAVGDQWPVVYFKQSGHVYSLGGNVYGAAGDPPLPPGISEADFQQVIDGFRFGS
jgi:hypothetical protein